IAEEKYGGDVYQAIGNAENLDQDAILNFKSQYFGIPKSFVSGQRVDPSLLGYIPEESAIQYRIAPIAMDNGVLHVGVTDPSNTQAIDALQFIASKNNIPYKVFIISEKDFNEILASYRGLGGEVDSALSDLDSELTKA